MEWIKEHKLYIAAGIAAALFFFYTYIDSEKLSDVDENPIVMESFPEKSDSVSEAPPLVMMADIKGAVNQPGVYEVKEDDRVIDVIELAGGLAADADAQSLNFAMRVTDEMVIYVPRKGEISGEGTAVVQTRDPAGDNKTVNLNKASSEELQTLPGIGPSKAEAIIEYRETEGPYKTIEDLKSISGIGDKTFEKLKELISVK
jgi:competence protein ComEA